MWLSIIIPVYNVEAYISKCLEELLKYNDDEIEIIAVSDGSKDNSVQIVKSFAAKDKRIMLIEQENQGVSAARNTGISVAKGEYLTFVDADDWIDSGLLNDVRKCLEDNRELELILTSHCEVKNNENCVKELPFSSRPAIEEVYETALISSKLNCCWGKFYRTDTIKNNNITFMKDVKIGEDIIFVIDYLEKIQSIYYLNKVLYYYRQNTEGAMSSLKLKHFIDMAETYKRRIAFCENNEKQWINEIKLYYRRAIYMYFRQIKTMNSDIKYKMNLLKQSIKMDFVREIILDDELNCKYQWQNKIKKVVRSGNFLALYMTMRKITMKDIFEN